MGNSFRREDEEVCVKQQLVRVQNKSCTMMELLLTQHCYNDNVFELPLAKQTKRNSNKQLAFEIFDRYLLCEELIRKGDSYNSFLSRA
jgi:hypothetical protein